MRVSSAILFAILFSVETFAAPVPLGDELLTDLQALDVRAVKKAAVKAKAKPVAKPIAKPVAKKPVVKPVAKLVAKPAAKPIAKPAVKPVAKPVAKPVTKPATKPVAKPVAKPVTKPVEKPVAKPAVKPAAKPVAKPVASAKPVAKPVPSGKAKPVSCPVKTKMKAATKVAGRSEAEPGDIDTRGMLVPRRAALSADVGAGTSNVCKQQVQNIQDFQAITLRTKTGTGLFGAKENIYDYTDGDATAHLTSTGFNPKKPTPFTQPADTTCEHILELNILKDVMESPGGVCEQIAAKFATNPDIPDLADCEIAELTPAELAKRNAALEKRAKDVKTLVDPIVKAINDKALNLVFTQKSLLEAQKTLVVEQATGRGTSLDVGGVSSPNRSNRLKAVNDYLTRTSAGAEGPNTLQVAKNIDAAITKNFKATSVTVADSWKKTLSVAKSLA
ncbi:hypothetical protein B0H14DRAFT_3132014 [Mycena olivaceomarginata]|nr:hypothetical protein B0H14DRAFT_3132014 [Mycena olivaceomarginata]